MQYWEGFILGPCFEDHRTQHNSQQSCVLVQGETLNETSASDEIQTYRMTEEKTSVQIEHGCEQFNIHNSTAINGSEVQEVK